jgi:hypothetical protein
MKSNKITETKEFLRKAYAILPTDFSLREVRFSINQAIQKIALFENKQVKKEAQARQQEELELKKKQQIGILPFQPYDAKQAISLIDKMIEEEERKINVKGQSQKQSDSQSDDNENLQTFYG